jgi:cytochrome b561
VHRYSIPSILLHWTMAAAIGAAWVIGLLLEELPRGGLLGLAQGVHVLLGLGVAALLLPRLLARFLGGAPDHLGPAWSVRLAAAAHLLLYVLMLAVPLTGLAIAMSGRAPLPVLGLFEIPPLLAGLGLRRALEGLHEMLANLLVATIGLHVAATLWHAVVRRDGVMRHMSPRGAR